MSFQKSIDSILDTPGVEGLFIFDLQGRLYLHHTPENLDKKEVKKLPQRVLMMYDIIADNFKTCSDLILKFEEKNLYFRKSHNVNDQAFVIAILGSSSVNFIALKLVTNLALKIINIEQLKPIKIT